MISVYIPIKFPSLNEYVHSINRNVYSGNRMKREYTEAVALYSRNLKPITEPVYIHFEWHEKTTRRDKDNVAFAKKFILDGLQEAGVLKNDNNQCVLGFTDTFVYDKTQGVKVTISSG